MALTYYQLGTTSTADVWVTWAGSWTSASASVTESCPQQNQQAYTQAYGSIFGQQASVPYGSHGLARAALMQAECAKREAAQAKAKALLRSYLDDAQRVEYDTTGEFTVTAPSGARFKLRAHGTALEYQRDLFGRFKAVFTHCLVSTGDIPEDDRLLQLKVLLAVDEAQFRRLAVRSRI